MRYFFSRNVTSKALEAALFSDTSRRQIFSGSAGLLFIHLDPETDPRERLEAMLVNRPAIPAIPVQIITCLSRTDFEELVDINRYVEEKLVSEYDVHQGGYFIKHFVKRIQLLA